MFLKAGYIEDFEYHGTISGTPQGGVISPILANIYLHGLDKKVLDLKMQFDKPQSRNRTHDYAYLRTKRNRLRKRISSVVGTERDALIDEYKSLTKKLLVTPSKIEDDKKLVYCRYADDFLIGISGTRTECDIIKATLKQFLLDDYSLELSDEKTKITHSSERIRFLGYNVAVRRSQVIKKDKNGVRKRTLNRSVELTVPLEDKITQYLFKNGIVKQMEDGTLWPVSVPKLRHCSDVSIVRRYDTQIRGICNYYRLAANYNKLSYFQYLMVYSCLKTLATKHNSTTRKILRKYWTQDGWGIPYHTKDGDKVARISDLAVCRNGKFCDDRDPWVCKPLRRRDLTIWNRLSLCQCELCGAHSEHVKVYHAGNMKNLNPNTDWGYLMISMRRKTLVVCEKCHDLIKAKF